ncbi:MAG: hypothetical protein NTY08_12210 [Proteobacteria bacterium]|nr:hypothetical protein [Pseudomonadota bacterium]
MFIGSKHRVYLSASTITIVVTGVLVAQPGLAGTRPRLGEVTAWPQQTVRDFLRKAQVSSVTTAVSEPQELVKAKNVGLPVDSGTIDHTNASLVLEIKITPSGLLFSPSRLAFTKVGQAAAIRLDRDIGDLALFVRDEKTLSLSREINQLSALKVGATEVYAFSNGRMYIVPVTVHGDSRQNNWDIRVPDNLISLNGVVPATTANANYSGLEAATSAQQVDQKEADSELQPDSSQPLSRDLVLKSPSLSESVAETTQAMERQTAEAQRFYRAKDEVGYHSVTLQLIDDRSDPEGGKIYPVVGANVRVMGTEFVGKTDATGHLTIRDMPKKSRFLVRVDDPNDTVRSALAELPTQKDGVVRLRLLRNLIFDGLSGIAGTVQQAGLGSYCGSVSEKASGRNHAPASGVEVRLDMPAEGPFYFNQYGFLDRAMASTGPDGRFCYFNTTPGPAGLSLYRGDVALMTQPVALFAGTHVEDELTLGNVRTLSVQLTSMATAQEQLSNDPSAAQAYKHVDMVDIIPFGTDTPMMQVGPGQVATQDPVPLTHGRQRVYARAAEFEPVVYTYNADDVQKVVPLIPRGFIEDMSIYAQVGHDSTLGAVLAEYSAPKGASKETIAMRLIDQSGADVGDGWYFSDAPLTKAIFFNVPAGTYSLQVQTRDGYWLGSDTVIVYNETTSFVQLGSGLRYRGSSTKDAKDDSK